MKLTSKIKPFKHQNECFEKYMDDRCHALFWDMGVGKSIQTILFIMYKANKFLNGVLPQTLIFAPLSVLRQWERELEVVNDEFKWEVLVMDKNKEYTAKDLKKVVIVNYEKVNSEKYYKFLMGINWQIIVLDESMRIKSFNAKTTKKIIALGDKNSHRLMGKYLLSGTPNPSGYEDLWSQFRFLNSALGDNYYVFRNTFFEDKNLPKKRYMLKYFPDYKLARGADEKISKLIKPYSSVVKKDECLDLPPLIRTTRFVELTADQNKHYKSMAKDFITYVQQGACVANIALTKLIRLQQIVMGFLNTENGICIPLENNRIDVLKEIVQEIPSVAQFIIWSNYKETYKHISDALKSLDVSYGFYTGICSAQEKAETLEQFKNGSIRCIIGNPASAGIGLNLQEANYMIYYQNSYSYMYDAQSEARCFRSGSERHTSVTRIDIVAEGTIDIDILKALKEKKDGLEYLINNLRGEL